MQRGQLCQAGSHAKRAGRKLGQPAILRLPWLTITSTGLVIWFIKAGFRLAYMG